FPPRCCSWDGGPFDLEVYRRILAPELLDEMEAREIEFSTPAPDRRYCHRPACSAFIPRNRIHDNVATCPECETATCNTCRGALHDGSNYPEDSAVEDVLSLTRAKGWQRCPSCQTLVELIDW
ncbi:hypothetical protein B0H66DRAFT_484592, partial [Apodospora peruviana]